VRGPDFVCGVQEVICQRVEPDVDLLSGGLCPLGRPSGGQSSGAGWIDYPGSFPLPQRFLCSVSGA